MLIAVAGATGTVGRPLAGELAKRGHAVRALSRSAPDYPVDLTTGAGLEAALDGVDVVVDATNAASPKAARALLIDGGRRLLDAEARAGVKHHVCMSIVGIEHVPLAYYRVKVEQEDLVRGAEVPSTIVRATQFHTLIAGLFDGGARFRALPGGSARFQPIDPKQVAELAAHYAEGPPRPETVTIAGPEVLELRTLARTYRQVTGRRAAIVPLPLAGKLGKALKGGALTDGAPDDRGTVGFGEWLVGRSRR